MTEFSESDRMHLKAVEGWLELGNPREANNELENITAELHAHPDVLNLRWQVYAKAGKWDTCLDIGEALLKLAPKNPSSWLYQATALHNLKRTAEAREALLPAAVRFPKDCRVRYDLARCACLVGELSEARAWLQQAFELGDQKKLKLMALDEPDLARIWVWAGL
jgi:predicted Zn-dependent protease